MEGLILRRIDYGESDQIIHLFLKEKGTVAAIAKGIKRSRHRFPHRLEPFRTYDFRLAERKPGRELYLIQAADPLQDFEEIQRDIRKIAMGNFIQEVLLISVKEGQPHPELYAFIVKFLRTLGGSEALIPLWFYVDIHIMRLIGFSPNFESCLKCNRPLEMGKENRFVPSGGILCPCCARKGPVAPNLVVSSASLGVLRFLKNTSLSAASRLKMTEDTRESIEKFLTDFMVYHLERPLKSLAFLREVLS